jgi:peptidoglycan endopeptidase LytE
MLTGTGSASAASLPTGVILTIGPGLPGGTSGALYRVEAGDTLGSIADRFGTTISSLAATNHLADPNLIYPGQLLTVRGAPATASRTSWGAPAGSTYRVEAGDTLGSIADRFGTTVSSLAATNHLADPNLIYPGQLLTLIGGAAPAAPVTHPAPTRPPTPSTPPPVARPSTPPTSTAPASTAAATAVRVALAQVGKPYQWAGAGPNAFDCSGLVMYAWGQAGVSLPHYTVSQYQDTARIGASQLQPGDLVFYDSGSGAQPGHVTIYIGNGQIVTADSPGTVVRVEVVDWDGTPIGYGRVR